jgi:hypothetical protein
MNIILNKLGETVNTARAVAHFPFDMLAAREPKNRLSKFVSQAADHLTRPLGPEYKNGLNSTKSRFGPTLFKAPKKVITEASDISESQTDQKRLTRRERTREIMSTMSRFLPQKSA